MGFVTTVMHYDMLAREGHDPVYDAPELQVHMDRWDGPAFLDALGLTLASDVLEIGVGTGRLAQRVLRRGCGSLTGIDLSKPTLEIAQKNLSAWSNVSYLWGDFCAFSFSCDYDIIYSSQAFFHIIGKNIAFDKAAGLLRPGGTFVLSIDKERNDWLEYGDRNVPLYPDDSEETKTLILRAGLTLMQAFDTEAAHIFMAKKPQ